MIKSNLFKSLIVFTSLLVCFACTEPKKELRLPKTDLAKEAMIPMPLKVVATNSAFALDQYTAIYTSSADGSLKEVGDFLSAKIQSKTGLRLPVNDTEGSTVERIIYINQTDDLNLGKDEAYQLYITKDSVILNAKTAEGAFRAVQTLRQVIPEKSNDTLNEHTIWPIPSGKIMDEPNFAFRGAMLDVARHFFNVLY